MVSSISLTQTAKKSKFIREFIALPKRLYKNNPHWVPLFDMDMRTILSKSHPLFDHSPGEFFLAEDENAAVCGRICVVANRSYAEQHRRKPAHFFFLDAIDSTEVFASLLNAANAWALENGCETLEGPMLFGGTYGSGLLVEGFASPPPLTMMPYNYPYYKRHIEEYGFSHLFDVVGADISPKHFSLPPKVISVAQKVEARGRLSVRRFNAKSQLRAVAPEIADLYNKTLADHHENYPLSDRELKLLASDLLAVADPRLIKILEYDGKIVGFLFAFHDLNSVLRKNKGRVSPLGILRLLLGFKQKRKIYCNGMAILPEYQRLGGNALLYHEVTKTMQSMGFEEAEIVQINEHTDLMLADIKRLGAVITKRHRIYCKPIS